jgi:predicted amino acid-binding ACT domain protein
VVNLRNEPDRGCSAVHVCTWDRAGLFSKIAGSLSATGLNILSAEIFTRRDGIVLDTFFVTDAIAGTPATTEQRDHFENLLGRGLTGEEVELHALIARQKISRPLYQAYSGERIPTQIVTDNDASETRTLIEIETEDRIGLLYTIAQTLTELQLDISAARVCTEKGAAIDSFTCRRSAAENPRSRTAEKHRAPAAMRFTRWMHRTGDAPGPFQEPSVFCSHSSRRAGITLSRSGCVDTAATGSGLQLPCPLPPDHGGARGAGFTWPNWLDHLGSTSLDAHLPKYDVNKESLGQRRPVVTLRGFTRTQAERCDGQEVICIA